jgi:hypothetical protein
MLTGAASFPADKSITVAGRLRHGAVLSFHDNMAKFFMKRAAGH